MSEQTLRVATSAPSRRLPLSIVDLIGYAGALLMVVALFLALVVAPLERVQGIHQKIFYMHVPLALLAYVSITVTFVASIMYLLKRKDDWDHIARASAEVGVIATTLTLVSGSLWGQPVWNAFWSWSDPRLVTTLVMWLMYVAYLMLRSLGGPGPRIARFAAVLGILGFANVPITYFSVYLWTYLHPVPTLQSGETPSEFFIPFLVSMLAFTLLYIYMMAQRVRLERSRDEVAALRQELES
jgi:heme exporter protein C